ncbi:cation transporter [Dankookia sp. P2]
MHSLALRADAGHNLSDALGLLLAWVGGWRSQQRPTRWQTYGY